MLPAKSRTTIGSRLAFVTAVVFVISTGFPLVAGLSRNTASFPKWWGTLDVCIAFLLGILAITVLAFARNQVDSRAEKATYLTYRALTHGILVMLVAFFLLGDRIVWINCLTGFAWRAWLLLYCLPSWLAALRPSTGKASPTGDGIMADFR